MKKYLQLLLSLTVMWSVSAQDYHSHVFYANQSRLPVRLVPVVTGNIASVEVMKLNFLPYEITHDHSSTIAVGDLVGIKEKDHNENNASLKFDRRRLFNTNNFTGRLEVRTGNDLLFTILTEGKDVSGPYVKIFYNIEYPDGTLELVPPGAVLADDQGVQAQVATREILYNGEPYKLVFGVFDERFDNTDNIIFSLSNGIDTIFRYDPPITDTANPNILHITTYNPGILMPLNISDQDEDERSEVLHKAMPKNMDVIVFQEFFEPQKTEQILDSLRPWYPYHTGAHNKILISGIGKEGGVRIVSKYPILEEKEISYSENGCVPDDFFSKFANKGVKYARINKQGQMVHIFGTHTSLQPCDLYIMGQFVAAANIPEDEIVIMAGDFNVDMNRYKNGSDDYTILLDTLNALEPTYLSFLNDPSYTGSTSGLNHMYCCNPDGRQHLDYVLVSSRHKIPYLLTNRSLQARLNEPDKSFGIFDMGDHEPVYARIAFPAIQAPQPQHATCIGQSVQLEALLEQPAPDGTIRWYKNGIEIPGAQSAILSVDISASDDFGTYQCVYTYEYMPDTVINNFFDPSYMDYQWYFRGATPGKISATIQVSPSDSAESCSGIATSLPVYEWHATTLYPNPASQQVTLTGQSLYEFRTFDIIDITGRLMNTFPVVVSGNSQQFDVKDFPAGMYLLRGFHKDGEIFQKPFFKVR